MRDINRALKILSRQYGMWILLFSIVLLVGQTVSVQSSIDITHKEFEKHYEEIILMDSIRNHGKAPKKDHQSLEKKYELKDLKKLNEIALKNYDQVMESSNTDDQMAIEGYQFFLVDNGDHTAKDGSHYYKSDTGFKKVLSEVNALDGIKKVSSGIGIVIFMAIILGMMFTSGEHITAFYQFSRTTPWPRWKDLMAKTLLGFFTVTILFILTIGVNYLILTNSPMKELFVFHHLDYLLKLYVMNVATFFFVLGIGAFAGNLFGHLGMLIMGYLGIELYLWDAETLYQVMTRTDTLSRNFMDDVSVQLDKLPEVLRVMISPARMLTNFGEGDSLSTVIGFLLIGLIYLALGFLYHEHSNADRSGMMILPPWLSKFIFAIAVITTSLILSSMFLFFGTQAPGAGYFGYLAFVLFLFISYKVYRVLFGLRIGL